MRCAVRLRIASYVSYIRMFEIVRGIDTHRIIYETLNAGCWHALLSETLSVIVISKRFACSV